VVRPRFRAGRKLVEAAPDAVAVGGLRELLSAKPGLPALRVSPVEVALGNTYHGYHTHAASKVVGASFVRRQRQSAEAVERRSEPRTGPTTAAGRHPSRMELGVIGLGRMGQIVVNRSLDAGHDVVAFDLSAEEATATAAEAGATAADSVADLCDRLDDSDEDGKRIWLMVPAGEPVDATLADLEPTSTPTTWSSTAGTRSFRSRSGAPRRRTPPTSTAARRAVPPAPRRASRS